MIDSEIEKIRKNFIEITKDRIYDSEKLISLIENMKEEIPDIFEKNLDDYEFLENRFWNKDYFYKNISYIKNNFSYERASHLVEVRERLRQHRIEGFAPIENSAQTRLQKTTPMDHTQPSLSDYLSQYVSGHDLADLRTALTFELQKAAHDEAYLLFALNEVAKRRPEAFVAYAADALAPAINPDSTQWSERHFDQQTAYLRRNFAKERFLHLIAVREQLRREGNPHFLPPPSKAAAQIPALRGAARRAERPEPEAASAQGSGKPKPRRLIASALALGGALLALTMLIFRIRG